MTPISRNPIYNLSAVLKETGLQADVLRAWERRYQLPKPQRTPGGHRLYSEYDIAIVKWLRARQREGLSISRAVELWKEMTGSGRNPLSEYSPAYFPDDQFVQTENNSLEALRNSWVKACLAFDAFKAEETVNQASAMLSIETVCFEILQKGLSKIGELWYQGESSVQQEHFASALAARRIETLITATPNPTREGTILAGCPSGEWHSFPVLLLTLLLRRKGLNVVYLGANTPLEQVEETAAAVHPALILLAAQQLSTAATLRQAAILFQELNIPLAYGGLVFNRIPELCGQIPAFFLGEDLESAIGRLDQLMAAPHPFPEIIKSGEDYQKTVALFRSKIPLIEGRLMEMIREEGLTGEYMAEVNTFFAAGLSAALELGNPGFLETELEWVKKLLTDRGISADRLKPYLQAYQQAVRLEMGEAGILITGWIAPIVANNRTIY